MALDLRLGHVFVLPKGTKKRKVRFVWEIESSHQFPENHWGKILVVTDDLSQFIFHKEKPVFIFNFLK